MTRFVMVIEADDGGLAPLAVGYVDERQCFISDVTLATPTATTTTNNACSEG